jgi:hypothetical protein
MKRSAKKSAGKRREKPAAAAVIYAARTAQNHWRGKRAAEFEALLQEWNTATNRQKGGGALLQELSALCDKEDADSRGTQVEGSDGRVFEFTVTLHPGMAPVTVWRWLDGNGVPNLRLPPEPDDEQARASLLKDMKNFSKISRSKLRKKPAAAAVTYSADIAHYHWNGKRAAEFGALLQEWNTATGSENSGGALLRELSALCDEKDAASRGTQVEGSDGLVVFEFMVMLNPGMAPTRVWRGLDGHGLPNLRLAPASDKEQERASLLKEMETSAKLIAGQWKK